MRDAEYDKQLLDELAHRSLALVFVETGLLVVIALTAIVGNSCVLYVFYHTPRLRSSGTSYYLVTLAISDILMAVFVMPCTIATYAVGKEPLSLSTGQVVGFVGFWLVYGSSHTTTLIAVNRFFCVVKPPIYRKYFKKNIIIATIVGFWLFSLLFIVLFIVSGASSFQFLPGTSLYLLSSDNATTERVFVALSQFSFAIAPLSIACVCYWKVHKVVKGHQLRVFSNITSNSLLTKEEIHITKSVLAVVCGFVLCWIPCSVVHHVSAYTKLSRSVQMIITYTAYSSSAINPIVYNIFNKPFRKQFVKVFRSHRVEEATQTASNIKTCGNIANSNKISTGI